MTIQRMDHVGVVVEDLEAAIEFFVELGLERQGGGSVGGEWVDRIIGLEGTQAELSMLQTRDGNGRLELVKFHSPPAEGGDGQAPANALGIRHISFEVEDIDTSSPACALVAASWSASSNATETSFGSATSAALRASSSSWPNGLRSGPDARAPRIKKRFRPNRKRNPLHCGTASPLARKTPRRTVGGGHSLSRRPPARACSPKGRRTPAGGSRALPRRSPVAPSSGGLR